MGDFEVHRLTIETLGEYLEAVRTDGGYNQVEVATKIGLPLKVLIALESANWRALPEAVYVVGFIRKLAQFYKVPCEPLVAQFYRESGIAKQQASLNKSKTWKVLASRLVPTRWAMVFSVVVGALFVGVCLWQIMAIGTVPNLVVRSPVAGSKVDSSLVMVSGLATPGSEVALNGQTVYAGSDGAFSSNISFLPGPQTLVVSAKSRFNKVATQTILFLVETSETNKVPAGPERPSGLPEQASGQQAALYAQNTSR